MDVDQIQWLDGDDESSRHNKRLVGSSCWSALLLLPPFCATHVQSTVQCSLRACKPQAATLTTLPTSTLPPFHLSCE